MAEAAKLISERGRALILAAAILDRPNGDPDDDLAVLARQLTRAQEEIDHYKRPRLVSLKDLASKVKPG